MEIKRALFSVYDKTGIIDFTRALIPLGVEIIATSGTMNFLKKSGGQLVKHVSDITQFPEILAGRVKTEHPTLIGGILALRNKREHMNELTKLGIKPIDMVVCNFYPIEKIIDRDLDIKIILENIDIGGPNMIRAAAKNFENVVVIVNPEKYDEVYQELKNTGDVSIETRSLLAVEAFKEITRYDNLIYKFLKTISVKE